MPLTLHQYATYLDGRDLNWPAPPEIEAPRAKPHLAPLENIRAVTWNIYGTLLRISFGDLVFEHPNDFIMGVALDKTIQEFKMWGSMSRKPGQPADYLREIYSQLLAEQRLFPGGGERFPEVLADRLWESFIKKLFQKDYKFDASFYGSLNEFSRKVAYFFHASLQGTVCYPGAAYALSYVAENGFAQGLIADGQCFTTVQLQRGLTEEDAEVNLDALVPAAHQVLSYEIRGRKPSERLFRQALNVLADQRITPDQVLHIGSRITQDIVPAKRLGLKTGLFAADKESLQAMPEQCKDIATRPDVLLTELGQIAEVLG
jgi:FMN phosphatase YigB (HAD superfamily)